MIVTYGDHPAIDAPTRHECTWPELLAWLQAVAPHVGEKAGRWLCFADFNGLQRSYANLVASHAIPLDLDEGRYAWDAASIAARLHGYSYAAWTSYSHTPERPRWRIIVPTAAPMSREQHYATWETLAALFLNDAGESSKDATRLNYLPGACAHPEHAQFLTGAGALFPVSVPSGTVTPISDELTDAPIDGYNGPADDDALLLYMLSNRRAAEDAFGAGPTRFEALWTADAAALGAKFPHHEQEFDHTRADAALANELAFYTGSHGTRMLDLFMRSALAQRDRFREDKARRACILACERAPEQHAFIRPRIVAPAITVTMTDPGENGNLSAQATGVGNVYPDGDSAASTPGSVSHPSDFFAYLPQHDYIHRPTGMHWPAASLDGTVGKDSRMMLDLTHPVHLESWAPGFPERFQYRELDETRPRAADSWVYNYYQAPRKPRQNGDIAPWLELLHRLYPGADAEHIIRYMADAVQNPGRKTNHALVLGSEVHGIGKDSMLRPLKWAVGERNYASINPAEIFDKNNAWAASVIVQISESRNVGDGDGHRISKYDMYERCKDLAAAPPTTLSCQDKWKARHEVRNCCRVIYTTNHGVDGIYLPIQDRRHYCAWSDAPAMTEADSLAFHKWCDAGGAERVAHYLTYLDISTWNPGARPPQTAWWWRLVREAEGDENPLAAAIERMGAPAWLTAERLAKEGGPDVAAWFADSRNRRHAGRHLATLGYRRVENPSDKRGRFNFPGNVRAVVYGKPDVTPDIIGTGR